MQLNSKDAPPIVTEHFRVVTGNHPGNPSYDHIALHHYLTRSRWVKRSQWSQSQWDQLGVYTAALSIIHT